MLAKVLCEGAFCTIPFCNRKGRRTQGIMILKAALRWRGFAENRRCILGHLDQFGCNHCVEPDQIGKHLLDLIVLHDRTFGRVCIKLYNTEMATFIVFNPRIIVDNDVIS